MDDKNGLGLDEKKQLARSRLEKEDSRNAYYGRIKTEEPASYNYYHGQENLPSVSREKAIEMSEENIKQLMTEITEEKQKFGLESPFTMALLGKKEALDTLKEEVQNQESALSKIEKDLHPFNGDTIAKGAIGNKDLLDSISTFGLNSDQTVNGLKQEIEQKSTAFYLFRHKLDDITKIYTEINQGSPLRVAYNKVVDPQAVHVIEDDLKEQLGNQIEKEEKALRVELKGYGVKDLDLKVAMTKVPSVNRLNWQFEYIQSLKQVLTKIEQINDYNPSFYRESLKYSYCRAFRIEG